MYNQIIKNYYLKILTFIKNNNNKKLMYLYLIYNLYFHLKYLSNLNYKKWITNKIKQIPFIKNKINNEKNKFRIKLKNELNEPINSLQKFNKLNPNGFNSKVITTLIKKYKNIKSFDWETGMVSGTVYTANNELDNLMNQIHSIYYRSNPLHPDIFPGIRKMEAEIVQMCGNLLYSKNLCAGSFTSGGTESIILACKTYRDIALKKGIYNPSIIVCKSGHAAYWKAGQYLGINIIEVPYDYQFKLTTSILNEYITSNTIAVITSAPGFHFGIIDNIKEIANYCKINNLYMHVDMCLGGFILPFIDKYNYISFKTDGITSISLDTHKYGCGPKGGSVILYKNEDLYKNQMFVKEDWTGGIYGTSNISGSRSGNIISLTWATMMFVGFNGYKKNSLKLLNLTEILKYEISKIENIFYFGDPKVCIVAIGSKVFDIYLLSDRLKGMGWNLNVLQNPPSFHLCITNCHDENIIYKFIDNIKICLDDIMNLKNNGNLTSSKSLYGSTQKIGDSDIIADVVRDYFCVLNDIQ